MKISAVIPQSTLDYPDKLCALIFVSPCNFKCGFCHNPTMVEENPTVVSEEETLNMLKTQATFIDAVTITGGEPTLQPDLLEFCLKLKEMGMSVKVDTNGSRPKVLKALIDSKGVDYIAMDIKAPLHWYGQAINTYVNEDALRTSMALLLEGKVAYEFRTTVVPHLITASRIEEMANMVKGARLYALQQYHNVVVLDKAYKFFEPYPRETLEEFKKIVEKYVQKSELRA